MLSGTLTQRYSRLVGQRAARVLGSGQRAAPMMVMSQLTLMPATWAMHMMAPMITAHTHTPTRDTSTSRPPSACGHSGTLTHQQAPRTRACDGTVLCLKWSPREQ